MGNAGSRPSCLGEKGQKSQDFLKDSYLKDLGLAPGNSTGRNNVEGRAPPPEKLLLSPVVIENGWNTGVGPGKGQHSGPLPKQNNTDIDVQNRSLGSNALKARLEAAWSPLAGLEPPRCSGSSWPAKPFAATEVTEVTEVTETVVTEIVEVTEYPGGDRSQQPVITRTVKVLSDSPGALPEGAAAFLEDFGSPEESQVTLKKLLLWIGDMEELMASQKPLSSEVKVVEAQLQEQKLFRRLLDERRPYLEELLLQNQKAPPESAGVSDGQEGSQGGGDLESLQEKWTLLIQEAEARRRSLERVLPAAQAFQESVTPFQDWLSFTERRLAQLWQIANGSLSRAQDTCQQIQDLCGEIRTKPGELEQVLEHGQRLLQVVSGEEAHLTQEKMDSLRMRFLIVGQSSADVLRRLEASCPLDPTQEGLGRWLDRLEKEVLPQGPCPGDRPSAGTPEDKEKFGQVLRSKLAKVSQLSQRLEDLGQVPLDAHTIRSQLASLKTLSAEILHHSGLVERLVAVAEPLLSAGTPDVQQPQLQPLVQSLQGQTEALVHQSSACTMRLEHAQSLLAQFTEAEEELQPWLQETQSAVGQLSPESISWEAFREQQEALQCLREAVAEHRPLVAKLQRLSGQLADVNPQEAAPFWRRWQAAEEQYGRIREHVHQAAAVLEEAIPRYSQLSERMQLMVESLERLQGHMQQPPAVRGDASWLQEQIRETSLRLVDLEKLGVALETLRGQGAELLATMQTSASVALQARVEQLLSQWQALWKQGEERESWLRSLLALADPFWRRLSLLALTLSETQQTVMDPEEVPSDAAAIQARLQAMQVLREEIDALQTELDSLGTLGTELVSSCGDLDKPDVTRSLDDLYSSWNDLSRVWMERQACLEEQLQATLAYQEAMERLLAWLEAAEQRVAEEFLVGGNLELVKQQLLELKDFKRELYQCKVDVESLKHPVSPRRGGKEPPSGDLSSFRARWNQLEEEVVCRQHQLESALLGLGQFQNQLEELLQWLEHTAEQLRGCPPLSLDLQGCEIELAKHKVLQNDVLSRARTVCSVKEAGQGLLLARVGGSTEGLRSSLQQLSQCWDFVLGETERRQLELENNLSQAQDFTVEIADLLRWLEHVELQLFCYKPTWAPPEAMKDSLAAHVELCKDMESKQQAYSGIQERLQPLLATSQPPQASSTKHCLSILDQKWDSVAKQLKERKEQLHEGLAASTAFHSTAQELLQWVGRAEETLDTLPPPSCILETVARQTEEQKSLLKEAQNRSAALVGLERTAARMKDFSWKQHGGGGGGGVAQSLLLAARERLARVLQRVDERGAVLEDARRRAKQFRESWQLLLAWLEEEAEVALEEPSEAARSQEEIKSLLSEHKDFQKGLRTKRPVYEATLRSGRLLREKALLPEDAQQLDEMLAELKDRWGAACSRAADRQRRLEEELLFSGRFTDTLQALMDWLYQAEPQLAEESPVAGDRDLVSALIDKHKVFQKELGQRAGCVKALRRSVRELTRGSSAGDARWLQSQIEELGQRWELICRLSVSKQDRLEAALRQAEEFHELTQTFLSRLGELEMSVKYGALPEDEAAAQETLGRLEELTASLQCQRLQLECLSSLAEEILLSCHPDSVITIRSWVTVSKSRFQEVQSWARQQEERLRARAALLAAERAEAARLVDWIAAAEESLLLRDREPLPEDAERLEELGCQHAVFMDELNLKQADVEKASRASCKRQVPAELRAIPAAAAVPKFNSRRRGTGRPCQEAPGMPLKDLEPQGPPLSQLVHRWQQLWLLALDRQYRLQNARQHVQELEDFAHFDFTVWRKRYLHWISRMKSRVLDVFRGIDRDQDGRITHQEFIESVLSSKFPTNTLEMNAVASIFDTNRDGFIDYYEFVSVLHPSRDMLRKSADVDQIQDEVNRQVAQCNCAKRFQVEQISANRYRFGESQQLRMVRILRSTLMVRVGGGWIALDEFLVKNDPCRVKGRTNLKINEKYLSADATGSKGASGASAAPCKALSPSRSYSSLYSSASAPSSPLPRKSVLRRTRSGDRCLHTRSSLISDGAELTFPGATETGADLGAGPSDPPEAPPP